MTAKSLRVRIAIECILLCGQTASLFPSPSRSGFSLTPKAGRSCPDARLTLRIGNVDSQLARMLPQDRIAEICRKHDVSQLSVYGLSSEREAASDEEVLFLATFHNDDSGPWGSKLDELENDLSGIVHDKVHVAHRRGIEQSTLQPRRDRILTLAQRIYES
jgi:predicted nucleotidyltransferase